MVVKSTAMTAAASVGGSSDGQKWVFGVVLGLGRKVHLKVLGSEQLCLKFQERDLGWLLVAAQVDYSSIEATLLLRWKRQRAP